METRLSRQPWTALAFAIGAALGLTVITYGVIGLLVAPSRYLHVLFYDRSWIQHANTFCFWLTIAFITLLNRAARAENRALEVGQAILRDPDLEGILTWLEAPRVRERFAAPAHEPLRPSRTFTRIINALDRLQKTESTAGLMDYFRTRSELDSAEVDTAYSDVRYFIWLIPTLGFVGTVMGIGVGIAGFADILQHTQSFQEIQKALPTVTGQLGTAFDTTFLALIYSVLAFFYMSVSLKRQEQLLQRIDALCIDQVCKLFREHSSASNELKALKDAIDAHFNLLITAMSGNRSSIEHVLRTEVPAFFRAEVEIVLRPLSAQVEQLAESMNRLASARSAAPDRSIEETRGAASLPRQAVGELATSSARLAECTRALQRMVEWLERRVGPPGTP